MLGIDVDPDAIAAARHNAERNGCGDRIALSLQDADAELPGEPFPLAVANLLAHTHLALAGATRASWRRAGRWSSAASSPTSVRPWQPSLGAGIVSAEASRIVEGWASLLLAPPRFLVTRFHIRPEAVEGDRVVFDAEETHHLARVLRLRPGRRRAGGGWARSRADRAARPQSAPRAAEGDIVEPRRRATESPARP